jgi:hypothetical protein
VDAAALHVDRDVDDGLALPVADDRAAVDGLEPLADARDGDVLVARPVGELRDALRLEHVAAAPLRVEDQADELPLRILDRLLRADVAFDEGQRDRIAGLARRRRRKHGDEEERRQGASTSHRGARQQESRALATQVARASAAQVSRQVPRTASMRLMPQMQTAAIARRPDA